MSEQSDTLRRRTVLKATSALTGVGLLSTVSGTNEETKRFNVGYEQRCGRDAVFGCADHVVREFTFDAATIDASPRREAELKDDPNVRYLEADTEMRALADRYPWGIERVGADVAHEDDRVDEAGDGAHVTIVDSGLSPSHSDLEENVGAGECFVSCASGCETCWDDDNGHGTHVAGTVAAARNDDGIVGVGPEATVHAAKVLDAEGSGTASDVAAALEWSADQGHDVANLSVGGGYSQLIADASSYAFDRGVLLVAAAGNDGCNDCVDYPAALSEVVAVSAVDENGRLASSSSYGPEIDLAAPGVDIESTYLDDSYTAADGTSMAAPHVAGAGAQLMADGYTNVEARERLQNTAEDLGLAPDEQGYGLVDVAAALGLSG